MASHELSFKESVDLMFDRAIATLDLPPGLADQIKINNNIYMVRFFVKLRDTYRIFHGMALCSQRASLARQRRHPLRTHSQPG